MMRSKLFVPGSRPELFEKAHLTAADAISFDLEDAVAADRKADARRWVAEALGRPRGGPRKTIIVRVNGFDSAHFEADLEAIVREGVDVVNLPKIESAEQIRRAGERLAEIEKARKIVAAANEMLPRGVGALVLDGRMIDEPFIVQARAVLAGQGVDDRDLGDQSRPRRAFRQFRRRAHRRVGRPL